MKKRQLSLNRETLRALQQGNTGLAKGGTLDPSNGPGKQCSGVTSCYIPSCPPTLTIVPMAQTAGSS